MRSNNLILSSTDGVSVWSSAWEGGRSYTDMWVYKSGRRPKSISLEKMLYLQRGSVLEPRFRRWLYPISNACPPSLSSSTSCNDTIRSRTVTTTRRPSGVVVKMVLGGGHCGWKLHGRSDVRSFNASMNTVQDQNKSRQNCACVRGAQQAPDW